MNSAHINFEGKAFPMTVVTPLHRWKRIILPVVIWFFRRAKLDDLIALRFIHFARWAVIKPQHFAAEDRDNVSRRYFLFSTNYNGPWDQYIDAFSVVKDVAIGLNWLWFSSAKFPCANPVRRFKRYIRYHEFPVDAYYNAYPNATVRDIERALRLQTLIEDFESQYDVANPPAPEDLLDLLNETATLVGGTATRFSPPNVTGQPRGLQL